MRICVVGAGAIGGLMAAKLSQAGNEVTVIDQGAHLAAIQQKSLKLIWEDGSEHVAKLKAVGSAAEAGPQDLVILAVKAHFLDQVARDVEKLLDNDTMIMTVQNGMPWWYFHNFPNDALNGTRLKSLDPSGVLDRKEVRRNDRATQMALVSIREAFEDAGLPERLEGEEAEATGILMGSGLGGTNTLIQYDLDAGAVEATLALTSAGYRNTYHYQ